MPTMQTPDGERLGYLDIGRGRPVVLLHGFGMRAVQWRLVLAGLESRYRFILPDMRGFGGSHDVSWTRADVLGQAADDLHGLIGHLGLERPVLAGLSMGACASMRYLGEYGDDAIAGYVNIDQAPCVRNGNGWRWGLFGDQQARWFDRFSELDQRLAALPEQLTYRQLPRSLRWQLEWVMARFFSFAFASRALAAGTAASMKLPLLGDYLLPRRNWRAMLACMRAYRREDYDFRPGLVAVRKPFTVMVGMRSRMYPPGGQLRFDRSVPHSRFLRFEGAGHALPFERPWQFRRALSASVDAM